MIIIISLLILIFFAILFPGFMRFIMLAFILALIFFMVTG